MQDPGRAIVTESNIAVTADLLMIIANNHILKVQSMLVTAT